MRRCDVAAVTLFAVGVSFGAAGCAGTTEPGGAATLSATTATALGGTAGTAVAPTPVVQVLGMNGAPVQGVTVTFEVTAGAGTVANATQVTDAQGTASAGTWVLGPAAGTHTLTASATGLTSVVFTAQAVANVCEVRTQIAVGGTANETLASGDCVISGAFADNYSLTTTASQAVEITMTSPEFDTFLGVASANGAPVAVNDDAHELTTNSRIKLLAAAGQHTVAASSFNPGATGQYSLQVAAADASAEDCDQVFIERGVTTEQTLSDSDCSLEAPYHDDQFIIFLAAGSQVRITQTSAEIDPYLLLLGPGGVLVAENDNATGETTGAQITYTATSSAFYLISASSAFEAETGAYTLTVDTPGTAFRSAPVLVPSNAGAVRSGGRKTRAAR
ncbi:MAG TPA: hypothetical protein VMM17_11055 [Gemmatimonadaceae bacterium]|nr:hypothetical protein [Gemmatimonadaceae bacterium]